jgi:beta-1,4-mannosyltransferase
MFGCGLPVCAAAYRCVGELVSHGHNGLLFSTPAQLAQQLADLFEGFPGRESALLGRLQHSVAASSAVTWEASWERIVKPMILGK